MSCFVVVGLLPDWSKVMTENDTMDYLLHPPFVGCFFCNGLRPSPPALEHVGVSHSGGGRKEEEEEKQEE